jgi:hypothetical protein
LQWHRVGILALSRSLDPVVRHFAVVRRKFNPNPVAAAQFCRYWVEETQHGWADRNKIVPLVEFTTKVLELIF